MTQLYDHDQQTDNVPEFIELQHKARKIRKQQTCKFCKSTFAPGNTLLYIVGKDEGKFVYFYACGRCAFGYENGPL
jgi:hypothetical protein